MKTDAPYHIGRYRVNARLGAGGMGTVYRAYDEKLRRDVAIKLLHDESGNTATRQLLHEARASSALNHPGICTVYEVEDDGDQAFIVMELVDGQRLSDLIPAGGLPFDSVRTYGLQVADALAHAHARHVVHRDVKPANILASRQGRTKILDFGLARQVGAKVVEGTTQTPSSVSDDLAGTLPYMAPEQLRGEPATARSDVWSLGVVLYELTSGRRPFDGDTVFTLSSRILADAPLPLPEQAPPGLKKVVLRCLAKDPGERYQDAGQVHAALDALETPRRPPSARSTSRSSPRARIKSLAVLPLENLSAESDEAYFADGMTDALITTLAQIGALRVISRTSVMRYKGTRLGLPDIARELNVDAIVEGTVLRSHGRIRIAAQLIHAATDTHLWAKQYETDLRDVLALQSEAARAIADEIRVKLSPHEKSRLAGSRPVDPAAYEAFLKGRYFWYKRSPDALNRAVEYLEQAVHLDPSFALAHAGLADAYAYLGWDLFGLALPSDVYPRAKRAAQRALELDPNCPEAHGAIGWIATGFDWDWAAAERAFRRTVELKPQYPQVHVWYSHLLRAIGRTGESLAESRRAIECDPLGLVPNMHHGWHHLYSRQYESAAEQCLKTLELDQTFIIARVFLAQAYEQLGRYSEAVTHFERAVDLSQRHQTYLAELGHGYAVAGRRTDALRTIEELMAISSTRFVAARGIAEIYMGLGDTDQALSWLEKAFSQHNGWLIHMREAPRYDNLRAEPRYLDLVRRMNFP
jgi:serine/threonine protein kinase/Tfp pilus assembly protein PilF